MLKINVSLILLLFFVFSRYSFSDKKIDGYKKSLVDRNKIFLSNVNKETLSNLVKNGQKPEAIILTCSDSRVIPEQIFNAKQGEFFVIRTAGEAVDAIEINSIEYAIKYLNVDKIIIMAHTHCGAVQAAIDEEERDSYLIKEINPSVAAAKKDCDLTKMSFSSCVAIDSIYKRYQQISRSKVVKSKNIKVYYALYYTESGAVEFLN